MGGLYNANNNLGSSSVNQIAGAFAPPSNHFRIMKLWWREML
jgi:hypothetical protein